MLQVVREIVNNPNDKTQASLMPALARHPLSQQDALLGTRRQAAAAHAQSQILHASPLVTSSYAMRSCCDKVWPPFSNAKSTRVCIALCEHPGWGVAACRSPTS